ncbi:hypothetical protein PMAYCL1PPCAC_32319, partial [Pristionchus mayeri]
MNLKQFEEEFGTHRDTRRIPLRVHLKRSLRGCLRPCSSPRLFLSTALSFVPIVQWLPQYNFRDDLVADLIGGITTGIMHVPQGLAYAILAGVDPVYGLYSSCFPALFYMLFGTSRHTSIGSFAVVNLMSGIANANIMRLHNSTKNVIEIDLMMGSNSTLPTSLTPIQAASTLTVAIGIMQFAAGILRLEFLASYFSDPLVSGFSTGSAVHILIAQLGDIFGLTGIPKSSGPSYIFTSMKNIALAAIDRTNYVALLASLISMSFLYCGKEYLSPYLNKKGLKVPVPYELILIIVSTALSAALDLQHNYNVPVVGHIPTGPPTLALPVVEILPDCFVQSIGMVIVSVAVHISLAKMYAKEFNYAVDTRQELYALGVSSMLGSLFSVFPVSTALGRTAVSVSAGTRTQMSTVFSCALLLVAIFWLGPLLQSLPTCVLGVVVIWSLKSMFQRCEEIKSLWRVSRTDPLVWIVSCTATVVIDVMEGLAISILFALLTVIFRSQWPKWERVLGTMSSESDKSMPEEAYLPRPSVCVFRFDAPLIFTNVERFVNKVKKTIDEWERDFEIREECRTSNQLQADDPIPRYFIIDCSAIAYVDYMGVKAISESLSDLKKRGITVHLAAVKPAVVVVLKAQGLLDNLSKEHIFPTLHDSLSFADMN